MQKMFVCRISLTSALKQHIELEKIFWNLLIHKGSSKCIYYLASGFVFVLLLVLEFRKYCDYEYECDIKTGTRFFCIKQSCKEQQNLKWPKMKIYWEQEQGKTR